MSAGFHYDFIISKLLTCKCVSRTVFLQTGTFFLLLLVKEGAIWPDRTDGNGPYSSDTQQAASCRGLSHQGQQRQRDVTPISTVSSTGASEVDYLGSGKNALGNGVVSKVIGT